MYIDAPTNGDVAVGVDDAVSKGKVIAKDTSGVNRDTDVLIFLRSRLSQATGDIEFVTKGTSVADIPCNAVANVTDVVVHPVPLQVTMSCARLHLYVVPNLSAEDGDKVAFRTRIQELQA